MSPASLMAYRRVLTLRGVRRALLLGILLRLPYLATAVLLTLHTTRTLGRTYAEAGLLAGLCTVGLALGGPWRGRLIDRHGLRPVVLTCTVVALTCWAIAPWVPFWGLLVLAPVAAFFAVPAFSVTRQVLLAATDDVDRRPALALDGTLVEILYIVVPALAVLAASRSTVWALFGMGMGTVLAGGLLWRTDPPVRRDRQRPSHAELPRRRAWMTRSFFGVALGASVVGVVLAGTDLTLIALAQRFGGPLDVATLLVSWGIGSLIGGLGYGALRQSLPLPVLLACLALSALPLSAANHLLSASFLAAFTGLFGPPTVNAAVETLAGVVPELVRGEAMGWYGAATNIGGALSAPLVGALIDSRGPGPAFLALGAVGSVLAVLVAVVGGPAVRRLGDPLPPN